MRPEVIGELVNGAIPVLGGIYATLLGYRVVGKKPGVNAKYDEWHSCYGQLLKVLVPVLVVFGMFLWATGISHVSTSSRTDLCRTGSDTQHQTASVVLSSLSHRSKIRNRPLGLNQIV